jgi:hypothetical protein
MASPAAAGPKGDLTSAFRTEANQYRNYEDGFVPDRPEGFITALLPPGSPTTIEVCDEQVVGTWFSWNEASREELENLPSNIEIRLDGEVLDTVRTPIKQRKLRNPLPDQDRVFVFTEGVPVLGTLSEGTHLLEYALIAGGVEVVTLSLTINVSDAYC